jgi:hypothetical protein
MFTAMGLIPGYRLTYCWNPANYLKLESSCFPFLDQFDVSVNLPNIIKKERWQNEERNDFIPVQHAHSGIHAYGMRTQRP